MSPTYEHNPYTGHDVCRAARKHVEPSPHWAQECVMFGYNPPKEEVPKMPMTYEQLRAAVEAEHGKEGVDLLDDLQYRLRAFKWMLDRETMKNIRVSNVFGTYYHGVKGNLNDEKAMVPLSELADALHTPYVDPPEGWVEFGTHAGYDPVPPLQFSLELDDMGLPMWERAVPE